MKSVLATFVGGPWDLHRVAMEVDPSSPSPKYYVPVIDFVAKEGDPLGDNPSFREAIYRKYDVPSLPGEDAVVYSFAGYTATRMDWRDDTIKTLRAQVAELRKFNDEKAKTIANKDQRILELANRNSEKIAVIADLRKKIAVAKGALTGLPLDAKVANKDAYEATLTWNAPFAAEKPSTYEKRRADKYGCEGTCRTCDFSYEAGARNPQ